MTTTIITRATKGAPLTYVELDANFTNLQATADSALAAVGVVGGKANASAIGVSTSATDMGSFAGASIPAGQTTKQAIQTLATAIGLNPRLTDSGYSPSGTTDYAAPMTAMFAAARSFNIPPGAYPLSGDPTMPTAGFSWRKQAGATFSGAGDLRDATNFPGFTYTGDLRYIQSAEVGASAASPQTTSHPLTFVTNNSSAAGSINPAAVWQQNKWNTTSQTGVQAGFFEAIDRAGNGAGRTDFVEGVRAQAVGFGASAYGAILVGQVGDGVTTPNALFAIGAEMEAIRATGDDAVLPMDWTNGDNFDVMSLATARYGVPVMAGFAVNPYNEVRSNVGFGVFNTFAAQGVARQSIEFASFFSNENDVPYGLFLRNIGFAAVSIDNNKPVVALNNAGDAELNLLYCDTQDRLVLGADNDSTILNGITRNNSASWPDPENSISTTATHTNGNATITVANGSLIHDGDAIFAAFVSEPVYVVSGGGTNTIVMSREASATGSGTAVRFGTDRWDMTSSTVGDTAGYRRLYIGQTAQGRSTMQPQINGQGLDYPDVTAFSCENELGGVSGWFGSRMSLENTGLASLISLGTYCLIDEDPVSRHCWNGYDQSNLLAGTEPTGTAQFIQRECSVESYWPVVDTDPFNYNPAGSTRIFRLDPGIGTYAERGEPFPENISHYIDFVSNGAKALKGLIFGIDALETSGGTVRPAAIALSGAAYGHAVSWYSGLATEAWKIFSTATTGNAYFWHQNGLIVSGEADIAVTKAAGNERAFRMLTNNVARWNVAATSTAESGANAGSDFALSRFDDAGTFVSLPLAIRRSTGRVSMADVASGTKYADNAAALSGGLVSGDLYATTAGDLRIVV